MTTEAKLRNLRDLLARVEAATGADRKLDLAAHLLVEHNEVVTLDLTGGYVPPGTPALTASLDAALALVERVLPTFTVDLTVYRTNAGEFWPHAMARLFCPYGEITEHRGDAPTPALALLTALLRALIAQADGENHE